MGADVFVGDAGCAQFVAQGADDLRVQLELAQAAHAILQVELQNVEVLKMEAEE